MIWIVNSYLYLYPINLQREFSNCKTQLCQGRTQWCQEIIVKEHIFGEFALVHLTFGSCPSPTETSPFTHHSFNGPDMCAVDHLQRLIFGNSQSPNKFTEKSKIVSIPTSSQESVKQKSMFMFIFKLRTIYVVNDTAQYLERCWTATDNDTIIAA